MEPVFTIGGALREGWRISNAHRWLFIKVFLTFLAIEIAGGIATAILGDHPTVESVIIRIAITIASFIVGCGLTVITLKLARGESAQYSDVIPAWEVVWRYLITSILGGAAIFIGFVLLVIPGIFLAIRLSMMKFTAVDGVVDPIHALKASYAMTRGHWWKLLGFAAVIVLINLLGAIAILLGLLITIPVTLVASAYIYDRLAKRMASSAAVPSAAPLAQ